MEDLGPEPFAGVDTADIAGVILFARLVAQAGNRLRLLHRGMVLPQHEHGVGVAGEFVAQRQHVAVGVDGRGVEPVLSTPIPTTAARCSALRDARTLFSAASIDSI